MEIITEDYVSFETAKLLEDKGFDWNCESKRFYPEPYYDQESPDGVYSPTLQMAMKWLRKVHNIHISTVYDYIEKTWNCNVEKFLIAHIEVLVGYNTYEEACEAAIKYCLENLI